MCTGNLNADAVTMKSAEYSDVHCADLLRPPPLVLDAEVGERQDAFFSDAIDPDDAVFGSIWLATSCSQSSSSPSYSATLGVLTLVFGD
jgi:hypothetical protein